MSDEEASKVTNKPGCVMKHWGGELFVYIAAGKIRNCEKSDLFLRSAEDCDQVPVFDDEWFTFGDKLPPGTSIHKL